jgi:hypothetical protein
VFRLTGKNDNGECAYTVCSENKNSKDLWLDMLVKLKLLEQGELSDDSFLPKGPT